MRDFGDSNLNRGIFYGDDLALALKTIRQTKKVNPMTAKRNQRGDIEMPKISDDFWRRQQEKRWTHVFHFKHREGGFYPLDYDGLPRSERRSDLPEFDLTKVEIFKSPDSPPWDDFIAWKHKYEYYLNKHFRPVFQTRGLDDSRGLNIDKAVVIIETTKYQLFKTFIVESGLSAHEDFILFLMAKIEEIYLDDVEHYDTPTQRDRIRKFPKEVEKLFAVLKNTERDYKDLEPGKRKPELQQVTFHFNTEQPIKITDHLLVSTITDSTRDSFADGVMKNWELQLKAYPSVYTANQQPNEFRHRICKALHNFFREVDAFHFGKKATTDAEIHAIAWMMNFAHVKFCNKKGEEYNIDTDKYDIRQIVRLYIKRKELVYERTHYSINEFKPDLPKLLKYFDEKFIKAGNSTYKESDIRQVFTITNRFGVNKLFPELLQLFTSLDAYHWMLGHQFEAPFNPEIERKNEDYRAIKALLNMFTVDGQLENLRFKIKGIDEEHSLNENASLEIIKEALREYRDSHKSDFEVDLYESSIGNTQRGFKLDITGKLRQPSNRFLPSFVAQCYDFLLKELPLEDHDWMPSERYYGVIGQLLLKSNFLEHQLVDDNVVTQRVKYWHSLTLPATTD